MGEAVSVNSALRATRKCRKRFAGGNGECVRMEESGNESDSGRRDDCCGRWV